ELLPDEVGDPCWQFDRMRAEGGPTASAVVATSLTGRRRMRLVVTPNSRVSAPTTRTCSGIVAAPNPPAEGFTVYLPARFRTTHTYLYGPDGTWTSENDLYGDRFLAY